MFFYGEIWLNCVSETVLMMSHKIHVHFYGEIRRIIP